MTAIQEADSKRCGRPRLAADVRRSLISLRVPAWLAEWLKNQPASSGVLIEQALCTVHGLKGPQAGRLPTKTDDVPEQQDARG